MKIVSTIIRTIFFIITVAFCALVVAFILGIIMPENLQKVIEIIKGTT